MSRTIHSVPPEDKLGVFKTVKDVPPRRKFSELAPADFPDEDPWTAFVEHRADELGWDSFDKYGRAGEYWREFMADEDRHYALADPTHIEAYFTELRNGGPRGSRTLRTLYSNYYAPLNGFYDWLKTHAEYKHAYNPVYMAATGDGTVNEIYHSDY